MGLSLNRIKTADSYSKDFAIANAKVMVNLDDSLRNRDWVFIKQAKATNFILSQDQLKIKTNNFNHYQTNIDLINFLSKWNVKSGDFDTTYNLDLKQLNFYKKRWINDFLFTLDFTFTSNNLNTLNRCWWLFSMLSLSISDLLKDKKTIASKIMMLWKNQFKELVSEYKDNFDRFTLIYKNNRFIILQNEIQLQLDLARGLEIIKDLIANEDRFQIISNYWNQDPENQFTKLSKSNLDQIKSLNWPIIDLLWYHRDLFDRFDIDYENNKYELIFRKFNFISIDYQVVIYFEDYHDINQNLMNVIIKTAQLLINQSHSIMINFDLDKDNINVSIFNQIEQHQSNYEMIVSNINRLKFKKLSLLNLKLQQLDPITLKQILYHSLWIFNNLKDYHLYQIEIQNRLEFNKKIEKSWFWKRLWCKIFRKNIKWYKLYKDVDLAKLKAIESNSYSLEIRPNCVQIKISTEKQKSTNYLLQAFFRTNDEFKKRIDLIEKLTDC